MSKVLKVLTTIHAVLYVLFIVTGSYGHTGDEPLVVNGQTVAERGTMATAKLVAAEQSGRMTGRSELTMVLLDLQKLHVRHSGMYNGIT